MKTEIIVKKLDEALRTRDFLAMYRLLEDLKKDAYVEAKGFTTNEKRAYKAALKLLEKAGKTRPVLGCAAIQTATDDQEYQVFTDSYCAFYLKNHFDLPKADQSYPNLVACMPKELGEQCEVNVNDVMKKIKSRSLPHIDDVDGKPLYIVPIGKDNKTCYINAEMFKTVVTILNETELKFYSNGMRNPVTVIDENTGNKAIMLGIMIKDGKIKNAD